MDYFMRTAQYCASLNKRTASSYDENSGLSNCWVEQMILDLPTRFLDAAINDRSCNAVRLISLCGGLLKFAVLCDMLLAIADMLADDDDDGVDKDLEPC
jgi:hypothetical protein